MRSSVKVQQYRPGEDVPQSGIYKVSHRGHHYDHEVTCISGAQFPECQQCRNSVRFSLLIAAHAVQRYSCFHQSEQSGVQSGRGL